MDPVASQLSMLLEHTKEQTDILRSMKEEQKGYMKQQTSLLTSMNEHLAKLNACNLQNKFEDEDHMKKGKGEQKFRMKDEQLHGSHAPWFSSSSPYYRLEIEGVVGVEDQTQGTPDSHTRGKPAGTSHTLTAGSPLNIRVILKKDDEKVPDDHPLANVKVQLVVLDEDFHIPDRDEHNSHPWWPPQDFTDHCMHLNQKVPTRRRMIVDKGEFRLNAGRGAPHQAATIKLNSQKKPVKLGVMILPDSQISCPRVLEGVSNSFRVQDPPRASKKEKTNQVLGKRQLNHVSESSISPEEPEWNAFVSSVEADHNKSPTMPLQLENTEHQFTANPQPEGLLQDPSTMHLDISPTLPTTYNKAGACHGAPPHNLMMGCVPNNTNNNDIQKILDDVSAARDKFEKGIWAAPNASLIQNLEVLQARLHGFNWMLQDKEGNAIKLVEAIQLVVADIDYVAQTEVVTLKSHLKMLHVKLCQIITGASSSVVTQQGNYGAPGGPSYDGQGRSVVPATDLNMMDPLQNTAPSSGQTRWTSGLSPTYLGNFLDQQFSEGYSVVPGEYDNAYAAGGEQIENTYGPYGYGNEGVVLVRNSRPALMRRPHQQKLADSPLLYTPMIIIPSSIPFGYLINDHYHGAMSMVGMSHQQAMNNEGVIRKHWKTMYRRVLIYEGWRLYGNNPIWWKNLIDNHAAVKRISQQQAMDEIVEMMMRRKKEVQVVVEPEPSSSSVLVNTKQQQEVKCQAAASLGDDKNKNKSFVVVDLKATCWDSDENKDRRLRQEIVELSSVLVDAATGHTKSTFHKYIIPTENHVLSEFCKNYNGMEQEAVERRNGAVMLSEALHLHQEWIGRLTNWNSVVVTWGNWDCRTMLKQECFRKELSIPDYFTQWINLKKPFADKYGNDYWNKSVKEALEATELLKWEGANKGGESHAHNKARLLSSLIQQGANLAITSWLDPAPNN